MESYVTAIYDDIACLGCLVLCNSLKQTGTEKKISAIVYSNVSQNLKNVLQKSFDYLFFTKDLYVSNNKNDFPNQIENSDKLKCWLLTQFSKCIFLESDVLVVENIDDLFERSEFSAVSDPRWPDRFDAGVFVYEPNQETYLSLINFANQNDLHDKTIQGLLNSFFSNWGIISIEHKIPFLYNCQLNSTFYTHTSALIHFGRSIKAARLGNSVLQMMQPDMIHDSNYDNWNRLWLQWWKIFNEMVKPALETNEDQDFNRTRWDITKSYNESSNKKHDVKIDTIESCASVVEEFPKDKKADNINYDNQNIETSDNKHCHGIPNNPVITEDEQVYLSCPREHISESIEDNIVLETYSETIHSSIPGENVEEVEDCHRQQWERGEIDYMGKDSFENILSKLNSNLSHQTDSSIVSTEE